MLYSNNIIPMLHLEKEIKKHEKVANIRYFLYIYLINNIKRICKTSSQGYKKFEYIATDREQKEF